MRKEPRHATQKFIARIPSSDKLTVYSFYIKSLPGLDRPSPTPFGLRRLTILATCHAHAPVTSLTEHCMSRASARCEATGRARITTTAVYLTGMCCQAYIGLYIT